MLGMVSLQETILPNKVYFCKYFDHCLRVIDQVLKKDGRFRFSAPWAASEDSLKGVTGRF